MVRVMKKAFSSARLVAILILALVSESSWALEVTMDLKAQGGGYPVIEGTTNLPDGVDVMITLIIPGVYMGQSQTVVSNGKFVSERFSSNGNSPVPSGTARVDVTTSLPDLQATSVQCMRPDIPSCATKPVATYAAATAQYHSPAASAGA